MPVYVVAQGRIENREMLDEYVAKVIPTIQSGGGRILGFDESPEIVEGEVEYPRTVILEVPSSEACRAWDDSITPEPCRSRPSSRMLLRAVSPCDS